MPVLTVRNATKSFGAHPALQGVSLEQETGELLALLGPNGAGKTTLVRSICGRVRLDGGEIEVLGQPIHAGQSHPELGVVPQEIALYPLLTARENLQAFGALHGVAKLDLPKRVDWALDWTGLADRAKEPIKNFSGGMKRRLNIACAVLHRPRVLLADEPTVGVDPQSREKIWDMLDALRTDGTSILLTTHHLEEAEVRCQRIVIVDHGKVAAAGSLAELVEQSIGNQRRVSLKLDRLPDPPLSDVEADPERRTIHALVTDVAAELPVLLERVRAAGCLVLDLEVKSPSLQAVFIHLTGKELRE